jgi:hypothetical protein
MRPAGTEAVMTRLALAVIAAAALFVLAIAWIGP